MRKEMTMADKEKPTILVVNVEEAVRCIAAKVIHAEGCPIIESTPETEVQEVTSQRPHLIVLGMNQPNICSSELCTRLKDDQSIVSIPVLCLPAINLETKDGISGLKDWADKYLFHQAKPTDMTAIKDSLPNLSHARKEEHYDIKQWLTGFDAISTPLSLLDAEGRILQHNRAFQMLVNKSDEEITGRFCYEIVHIFSDFIDMCPHVRARKSKKRTTLKVNVGDKLYLITADPLLDVNGEIICLAHIMTDITEYKHEEDTLRRSESLFRNLFEHHSAVMLILNPDTGDIIDANNAAARFYGWPRTQLKQMKIKDINLFPPEVIQEEMEKARRFKQNIFEFRHGRADDSIRDVEVFTTKFEVEGQDLLHSIIHDITDRKQTEESLRRSEALLKQTQWITKVGGWEYHVEEKRVDWTDEVYRIYGISPEQYGPKDVTQDVVFYEDRGAMENAFRCAVETGKSYDLKLKLRNALGENLWVRTIGNAEVKDGKVVRLFGNIMDITERKQAEERLKDSEERFRLLAETSPDAILLLAPDGIVQYVSPVIEQILKVPSELVTGVRFTGYFKGNDYICSEEILASVRMGEVVRGKELKATRPDQSHVFLEISAVPVYKDDAIIGIQGVVRDITSRKELELQLFQSQKMEALGSLAGGIAHDFNNILSSIIGYTELSKKWAEPGSELGMNLQIILDAGVRARDLIKQILYISKQTSKDSVPIDVKYLIQEVVKLLRASIPASIDIQCSLDSTSIVMADPINIHQIILNLLTNAVQAMDGPVGTISITLDEMDACPESIQDMGDTLSKRYQRLTIKDTGRGIPNDIMPHIFKPFFTTKEKDKGTGLGLFMVKTLIQEYGGHISIESQQGEGTTFRILLPIVEGVAQPLETDEEPIQTGNERILFVDDEKTISFISKEMLKGFGYSVVSLNSSIEALRLFKNIPDQFDLVITDLAMPHMTGMELSAKLLKIRRDIPIILSSGYQEPSLADEALAMGIKKFVKKPFKSFELASAVRAVLDGKL